MGSTIPEEIVRVIRGVQGKANLPNNGERIGKHAWLITAVTLSGNDLKVLRKFVREHAFDLEGGDGLADALYVCNRLGILGESADNRWMVTVAKIGGILSV